MSLVPKGTHTSNYADIREANWVFYCMVISLSGSLQNARKRAEKFGWGFDLTLAHLVELWIDQGGRCAESDIILDHQKGQSYNKNPRKASVDRVDNNQGYVKGNVRLLTHWNNNAKSTYDDSINDLFISETYKFKNKPRT